MIMGTVRKVWEHYARAYGSIPGTVSSVVARTADVILDLNKDQLLQGRDADGELLSPTYTGDPYFETPEAGKFYKNARGYLRMKQLLEAAHRGRIGIVELYGEKPADVPNLIITGPYHDSMFIRVTGDTFTIDATYEDADDINAKYKGRVYGVAPKSRDYYWFGFVRDAILGLYAKK
jgi:hypothetical protein